MICRELRALHLWVKIGRGVCPFYMWPVLWETSLFFLWLTVCQMSFYQICTCFHYLSSFFFLSLCPGGYQYAADVRRPLLQNVSPNTSNTLLLNQSFFFFKDGIPNAPCLLYTNVNPAFTFLVFTINFSTHTHTHTHTHIDTHTKPAPPGSRAELCNE